MVARPYLAANGRGMIAPRSRDCHNTILVLAWEGPDASGSIPWRGRAERRPPGTGSPGSDPLRVRRRPTAGDPRPAGLRDAELQLALGGRMAGAYARRPQAPRTRGRLSVADRAGLRCRFPPPSDAPWT